MVRKSKPEERLSAASWPSRRGCACATAKKWPVCAVLLCRREIALKGLRPRRRSCLKLSTEPSSTGMGADARGAEADVANVPWPSSLKTSSRFSDSFSFLPLLRFLPPFPGHPQPDRQEKRAVSTHRPGYCLGDNKFYLCSSACSTSLEDKKKKKGKNEQFESRSSKNDPLICKVTPSNNHYRRGSSPRHKNRSKLLEFIKTQRVFWDMSSLWES
jgi:hypothetical protein